MLIKEIGKHERERHRERNKDRERRCVLKRWKEQEKDRFENKIMKIRVFCTER